MRPGAAGRSLFWRLRGSSAVVLQVEVADFTLPDVKGQPPIAADRNAPPPGAGPSYSPAAWQSARYSRRGFWKISAAGAKPISPQAKFVHSAAGRGPKRWQLIKLVRNRTKALGEFPIWINNYNRLAL